MAVLAPTSEWKHTTRDRELENSKQFASPSSMDKRHTPSPSHQHQSSPSQSPQSQHGPHSPIQQPLGAFQGQQQPQGSWTPSPTAPPFYPGAFQYQPHQQPPSPYSHSPIQQQQPQQSLGPYFDPTQAQLAAQWAYQQAYYAQQHNFPVNHSPSPPHPQQRPEFFAGPNAGAFNMNPFPSGTPPPQNGYNGGPGYHPYRRPTNPNSRQGSQASGAEDRRGAGPTPPYARPDAAGSTSSLGSQERQRTNSNNSAQHVPSPPSSTRSRSNGSPVPAASRYSPAQSSPASATSPPSNTAPVPPRLPHHRSSSSSSSNTTTGSSARPAHRPSASSSSSAVSAAAPAASPAPPAPSTSPAPRLSRPSPLSQGNFTAAEKRMSRDDSELDPLPSAQMVRNGGLKGRLRRALAFNPNQHQTVKEETDDEGPGSGVSALRKGKGPAPLDIRPSLSDGDAIASPDVDDGASTATRHTKKRSRSLFNMRNASTDNISLSSTVSSASVMIRKLGSMGKLARRNSLASITSLFKDKDKDKDGEGKKSKKDKSSKGEPSNPSVSMYTAEIDRSSDWSAPEMTGLSPAAKLARQHTLKSNAEAAAKAKEAETLASASKATGQTNGSANVPTWEKNTATGHGSSPVKGSGVRVNEDGTRVFVEDDIEEEPSDEGHYGAHPNYQPDGWDDDEDWDGDNDNDNDEDVTIRIGTERLTVEDRPDEDVEPWATDLRRSEERVRLPTKGILKHAGTYDQQSYLNEGQGPTRTRSNSYNSPAAGQSEPGPLAHGPSSDADLDGLHRHGSHNSGHGAAAPSLPPLSFDSSLSSPLPQLSTESPPDTPVQTQHPQPERPSSIFNHPNLNSSAPALSTMLNPPPTLTHRSATAPSKRLVFANNLSVYDTFSANVYDRRSEPATWSRLTPALAQRIKEELNSYKMEEMEVHASSRVHTQFFV